MPDPTKPRPIDALLGADNAPALPNYVIEPAPPATTVSPPPPAATMPPSPDVASEDVDAPMPPPAAIFEPVVMAEPLAATPAPLPPEERFAALGERIERLYSEVKIDLRESQAASTLCFEWLRQARQAVETRDYARAEFFIHSVDAKLKRSQKSIQAARGVGMILLWVWQLLALGAGAGLIAMTYIVNLTLFGLPVVPDLIVLVRAAGWGIVGSVSGTLYAVPRAIVLREYDAAYTMHYVARPFIGALLGALLFLLSQAGIVAGTLVIGDVKVGPLFLYVFAFLAGFKQEYIGEMFDGMMRAVFRSKQ